MSDEKDTLPAPHPDTPEWAVQHYNLMLRTYHAVIHAGRIDDAKLLPIRADIADLYKRVKRLESNGSGHWPSEATNPGGSGAGE